MTLPYPDRKTAGRELAERLATMHFEAPPVVLALPRGGVPVAVEVAKRLDAPLDLLLVRKIGTPGQLELALAAVADGDPPELVMDDEVQRIVRADADYLEQARADAERSG